MDSTVAVGGVMPATPAAPAAPGSLLDLWTAGWAHRATFANAGSALAALLRQRGVRRAWLPAYACTVVATAIRAAGAEARCYRTDSRLDADVDVVGRQAREGDAVIGIDYFGRAPGPDFLALRALRPDLLWIEDRAQALDTGAAAWGEAVIYSPRKLVGVGDGGLMLSRSPLPAPGAGFLDLWGPEDARALDPGGFAPETWRGRFQAREAGMRIGDAAMSPRSLAALAALPAVEIAEARRDNWARLAGPLRDFALWPDDRPRFAPLAFPIVVADAAAAVAALAAERIWAPRHWPELPGEADAFPQAHALSRRMVSLPCDQRYGAADMARVAEVVLRRLQPR